MMSYYGTIQPIDRPIRADRQGAKRHYGVHPYFTRRPHNVVSEYIRRFSRERDIVVDPFGGSGVTAIEAWLLNRTGIQNDINPLANMIAAGIHSLAEGETATLFEALDQVRLETQGALQRLPAEDNGNLENHPLRNLLPANIELPRNSDAKQYFDLFQHRQLIGLAIIKQAIERVDDVNVKQALTLAWSATLAKINKTFLSAEGRAESRGGSSIFSIYRYKVASKPVSLPIWSTFEERVLNIAEAKDEIRKTIDTRKAAEGWFGHFESRALDIHDLAVEFKGKADYVFTDPPYGGHISYLDLSTLWNNWLGQMPSEAARENEIIVGGDLKHSEESYVRRLGDSVTDCLAMLKPDRWMSVVFQHWNVSYFAAILDSASESGAELKSAVSQIGDPIWSMHKKKNQSVLAGELILTFQKTGLKKPCRKVGSFDVGKAVENLLLRAGDQVYGEALLNDLILGAWRHNAIDELNIDRESFVEMMGSNGWLYDEKHHRWSKNQKEAGLFSHAG